MLFINRDVRICYELTKSVPASPQQRKVLLVSGYGIPKRGIYVRMLMEHLESLKDVSGRHMVAACTFDLRGLGDSPAPPRLGQYTTTNFADDGLALLNHVGWEGDVHLFGSSLGGQIACKMAAREPERFASLTLVGAAQGWQLALAAFCRRPLVSGAMLLGQLPGLHHLAAWAVLHHLFSDEWLHAPWTGDSSEGSSAQARQVTRLAQLMALSADPNRPNRLQDNTMCSTARAGQALACAGHWLSKAEADRIRSAGFPVLAVTGSHDGITPAMSMAQLAQRLGGSFRTFPGGHAGIMVEHADEVLASIERIILEQAVSSKAQRLEAKQRAEQALQTNSYAFWEYALLHFFWGLVLGVLAILQSHGRCRQRKPASK